MSDKEQAVAAFWRTVAWAANNPLDAVLGTVLVLLVIKWLWRDW